jgi:biopolymer transport protein ExbD
VTTVRFTSPIQRRHARIEIIPLIDIMFFLLASFMMVSLNMTKVENIQVSLPSATQVQEQFGADMIHIAVDKSGGVWVEKNRITPPELFTVLTNRFHHNERMPVLIGGDAQTRHGDMVAVLELVRKAGVQKVSFTATAGPPPGSSSP